MPGLRRGELSSLESAAVNARGQPAHSLLRPSIAAVVAVCVGAWTLGGCTRYAHTRVFLHGEVVNEDARPVPYAVVRLGERETVADEKGHYRFLYLSYCVRGYAGNKGDQGGAVRVYAPGYAPLELGFHVDSIEAVGLATCPKDTDRYLRLTMVRALPGQ